MNRYMHFLRRISLAIILGLISHIFAYSAPIPASCTPNTLNYCCGFGITNVSFGTINNASNDGADGYSDFTSLTTTVLEGQSYNLSIQTTAPNSSNQNYAAWIDFNNDGVLDDITERVATINSQLNTVFSITIPSGAVLNTDLRLRIAADFNLSAAPTPCADVDRGQIEDYTVVIMPNPNPPIAAFYASDTLVCDGLVCFTDNSLNIPTSWSWDFGDGNNSFQQNPCHTYTTDGTYTVSLVATNANGSSSDTISNYITVNAAGQVIASSCNPSTVSYCCGYGIIGVNFGGINNITPDGQEGYQDFSCTNSAALIAGNGYPITITTDVSNPQDIRVWIDYNNDGVFNNSSELVMDAPNSFSPAQTIQVPFGAILDEPLRLRVSADIVGTAQTACDNNDRGQTEDYSVIISNPNEVGELDQNELSLKIFPNPAKEVLYIERHHLKNQAYELYFYNSIGQQVLYLKESNEKLIKIDVSAYQKGVYFLTIKSEDLVQTKKVLIN